MRKFIYALLIGLSVTGLAIQYSNQVTRDISDNVIRLHIRANSDSPEDQQLKLKVRDSVVSYLSQNLDDGAGIDEARQRIVNNLDGIKMAAYDEMIRNGYAYKVDVQLGRFDFPTKYYDNFSLPKGRYEALQIVLGEGRGENWWCVIYPNLCFVNEIVSLPSDGMTKLSKVLSADELRLISSPDDYPIKLKFKLVEVLSLRKGDL